MKIFTFLFFNSSMRWKIKVTTCIDRFRPVAVYVPVWLGVVWLNPNRCCCDDPRYHFAVTVTLFQRHRVGQSAADGTLSYLEQVNTNCCVSFSEWVEHFLNVLAHLMSMGLCHITKNKASFSTRIFFFHFKLFLAQRNISLFPVMKISNFSELCPWVYMLCFYTVAPEYLHFDKTV